MRQAHILLNKLLILEWCMASSWFFPRGYRNGTEKWPVSGGAALQQKLHPLVFLDDADTPFQNSLHSRATAGSSQHADGSRL